MVCVGQGLALATKPHEFYVYTIFYMSISVITKYSLTLF